MDVGGGRARAAPPPYPFATGLQDPRRPETRDSERGTARSIVGRGGWLRVGALVAVIVVQALAPMSVQAAATVDLDQWASSDKAWQNGNLNGNNSRYPEGGIVPFRLAIEGLKAGEHRSTSTTT